LLVTPKSFDEARKVLQDGTAPATPLYQIEPHENDRVELNGIVYEVLKLKEVLFAGRDLAYFAYLKEATFTAQKEEQREKKDDKFEPDVTQDEDETDTTGVNVDKFEDKPATVYGTVTETFDIEAGVDDQFKCKVNEGSEVTITLNDGLDLTADEIVTDMQAKLDAALGSNIIVVRTESGIVILETVLEGTDASIEIMTVSNNCYTELGFSVGVTQGTHKLNVVDDGDYDEEGNPV
jgi:hypothetical protein